MPRALQTGIASVIAITGLTLSLPLAPGTPAVDKNPYPDAAISAVRAAMRQSDVDTGNAVIRLSGVADAGEAWNRAVQTFRDALPAESQLVMDVFVIDKSQPLDNLCRKMFASIAHETVSFHESGTQIRQGSFAALDRVAEFGRDCPQTDILITGHSDGSGNENNNRRLSEARAKTVAEVLLKRGANDAQLRVVGAGSAYPVADNATAIGREKNRRIEFSLDQVETN